MKALILALTVLTFEASAASKTEVNELCSMITKTEVSMFDAYRAKVPKLTILQNQRNLPIPMQTYFKGEANDIWAGVYDSYPKDKFQNMVFLKCVTAFTISLRK